MSKSFGLMKWVGQLRRKARHSAPRRHTRTVRLEQLEVRCVLTAPIAYDDSLAWDAQGNPPIDQDGNPVLVPLSTPEDTRLRLYTRPTFDGIVFSGGYNGLVANDVDPTNDFNPNGDLLHPTNFSNPDHGLIVFSTDGKTIYYLPNNNYVGPDSFTYQAADNSLESIAHFSNAATVNVTVTPPVSNINPGINPNLDPFRPFDGYQTPQGSTLVVDAVHGILSNDSNNLTAVLVDPPIHGTLTLNFDGSLTYVPDPQYNGFADGFTYRGFNGDQHTETTQVFLGVGGKALLSQPDSMIEGDSITLDGSGTAGSATGNYTYYWDIDPNPHGFDPDSFHSPFFFSDYDLSDGEISTGNDPHLTLTWAQLNQYGVVDGNSSPDNPGPIVTLIVVDHDHADRMSVSCGFLSIGDQTPYFTDFTLHPAATGSKVVLDGHFFEPNPAENTFTVSIDWDILDADPPVPVTYHLSGDRTYALDPIDHLYPTDHDAWPVVHIVGSDPDEHDQPFGMILSSPSFDLPLAKVRPAAVAIDVVAPDIGTPADSYTWSVSQDGGPFSSPVTTTDPNFSFTPATRGVYDVHVDVMFHFDFLPDFEFTNPYDDTYIVTAGGANHPPVAADDSYSTDEDSTLVVGAASGLLANDTDADGNALTAAVRQAPAHGALTLNPDGSFTYVPAANYHGADSFIYRDFDGTDPSNDATVSLTINAVNDAPTTADDSYNTPEDTPLNVAASGVLANDSDIDGDSLTAILVSGPAHGSLTLNADGSFGYLPAANYNGSDAFIYHAFDGAAGGNDATISLTISAVNDPPTAVADAGFSTFEDTQLTISGAVLVQNDTDVDNDPLTAVIATGPAHGALNAAGGLLVYTPGSHFNGLDSFAYRASDGTDLSANAVIVSISVVHVNHAPVAVADSYSTQEDTPLLVPTSGVLGNDSDPDGNSFTAVLVSAPAHGNLTLNADGSFSYSPNANYNGPDSFTYQANDGQALSNLSNIVAVALSIGAVNEAPTLSVASSSVTVNEGQTATNSGSFGDVDGDAVALSASIGAVTKSGNTWNWSFATNDGPIQSQNVTITADDGHGGTAAVTFALVVNNVAPTVTINGAPASVTDGTPVNLTSAVSDPGSETFSYNWSVTKNGAAFATGSAATFSFTPSGAATYVVTLQVNDGDGGIDTDTKTITVTPINPPPGVTLSADGTLSIVGTNSSTADVVTVTTFSNTMRVTGNFLPGGFVDKPAGSVNTIQIVLGNGNDVVVIAGNVDLPVLAFGGSGDDVMVAGAGPCVFVGGDGIDTLVGGRGRNVLIGGMGADTLVGGSGEDLLIAGGTTFDSNAVALMAILAEWNSAHSQAQRVKNLTNGTVDSQTGDIHAPTGAGLNRLNGDYFLISGAGATADQPATLLHETSIDVLVGGGGWDWLIIDSLDIDAGSKHDLVEALNS